MRLVESETQTVIIPPTPTILAPPRLAFPPTSIVGSIGDLAHALAFGTEVPPEFFFAAGLTTLGAACGRLLSVDVGFDVEPRLYTVLLGDSYGAKKSTAMKKILKFFQGLAIANPPNVVYGLGSAEGLVRVLQEHPNTLIAYDELRSFLDKTKVQGSVLLPMMTALFEQNKWANVTKNRKQSMPVEDAHVSLIGACTTATFSDMWTPEAISIGFPNRLFVVNADRTGKVAWPISPDDKALAGLQTLIQQQLARLPRTLSITTDAKKEWADWYNNLPSSQHTSRLDTIGFRLLALIALTTDKEQIDLETVRTVTAILDYELRVRTLLDPIDADNTISKLEEKIRRALTAKGPLSKRDLRRDTHADRAGIWAFEAALNNLLRAEDIELEHGLFKLRTAPC